MGCCNGENHWGELTQKSIIGSYERLSPQAQRAIFELLLNTQGVKRQVEQALKRAIDDPQLVKNYVKGADFIAEAIKKEMRQETQFAISLFDAVRSKEAATYGLTYDRYNQDILFKKPKPSIKSNLPKGRKSSLPTGRKSNLPAGR